LHQIDLFRPTRIAAVFARFDAVWSQQSNRDYAPDIPGDDFWQFTSLRATGSAARAEARVGC